MYLQLSENFMKITNQFTLFIWKGYLLVADDSAPDFGEGFSSLDLIEDRSWYLNFDFPAHPQKIH